MCNLVNVPVLYGRQSITATVPEKNLLNIIETKPNVSTKTGEEIISEALAHPIGSPSLYELSKGVKDILIITSDHTRSVPSQITLPAIINSLYYNSEYYNITILIATGLHRAMTDTEMAERFGQLYTKKICRFVNHDANDKLRLLSFGNLADGTPLLLNAEIAQNDLIIGEGFIEPHFFAGFSGGRKCILPGVAGAATIISNHSAENISNPKAQIGILEGNPIHEQAVEAAELAGLKFILNVMLDKEKKIIGAVAGDFNKAHTAGCEFVKKYMTCPARQADIVITSNSGYPLDINFYQLVKGIDSASYAVKKGGIIIIAAELIDGIGHEHYGDMLKRSKTIEELYCNTMHETSEYDRWQAQIFARILKEYTVYVVTKSAAISKDDLYAMHVDAFYTIEEALEVAFHKLGKDATINIIPEGPTVITHIID